ncbi:MAG: hypothetical protein IJM80_06465 [Firmicutes bacterium]|nr:hypothetical protein [Bacillota bacterium]
MKDDLLIMNTLGKRSLPRILPVMVLAAAAVTFAVIKNGSLSFAIDKVDYGGYVAPRFSLDAGFLLLMVLCVELIWAGRVLVPSPKKSRYMYKVRMLRISERRAFLDCCVFNVLVYLLIWASLCCAALVFGKALGSSGAFGSSPQAHYAALMLSGYMQAFVPMDNGAVAAASIMFMVSMGLLSAQSLPGVSKGKRSPMQLIAVLVLIWSVRWLDWAEGLMGWLATAVLMLIVSAALALNTFSGLSRGTNVEADDGE